MHVAAQKSSKMLLNLTLRHTQFHRFLPEFGVTEHLFVISRRLSHGKSYFLEAESLNNTGKNNHRMQDNILDSVLMYVAKEAA